MLRDTLPAQSPAQLDAGQARQHPIQDDKIRRVLADGHFRFVAANGDCDAKAFGFEIVLKQRRQRLFVLDNQHLRVHRPAPVALDMKGLSPRCVRMRQNERPARAIGFRALVAKNLPLDAIINRFRDVGRVIADPLKIFGAEKEVGI